MGTRTGAAGIGVRVELGVWLKILGYVTDNVDGVDTAATVGFLFAGGVFEPQPLTTVMLFCPISLTSHE